MERFVTATEANQRFSELLRDVQAGESYVVTSRGKPVARMTPVVIDQQARRQNIRELLDYAKTLPRRTAGPWTREDLYD